MTETPPPRRPLATFLRRPAREAQAREEIPAEAASLAPAGGETPLQEAEASPAANAPDVEGASPAVSNATAAAPQVEPPLADLADLADALSPPAPASAASAVETDAASDAVATAPAVDWRAAALPVAAIPAPTFAQPRVRARTPRASVWQWLVLVALALLLVLQILLADRARFASEARWRPLLSTLCGALHCDLPVWHEPAAFTMLDRDVRPAPGETGVLRIQASFRNDARWNQAWPWLQLSLSDADGRVIGSRVFSPNEYLGHAPDPAETLAPGQSGRIDFRVREPAAGTAAFTFDFH